MLRYLVLDFYHNPYFRMEKNNEMRTGYIVHSRPTGW